MSVKIWLALSVVAAPAIITAASAQNVMDGGRKLQTTLTPGAEVPGPGDPNASASGTATVTVNPGQRRVCYSVSVSGLTGDVTVAHIHVGGITASGPPVVDLIPPVGENCVTVTRQLATAILKNPQNYYVNVHTSVRPNGAVRGQLAK